ncbi:hypothetical protein WN944_019972 [Citrus x changshan-huyou]|uniref:Uncharacterized protein n=1 Tax=Citrus x changshan-huyou TaxID=2935761 RepID=A0AAP0QGE6_9ROSI
MKRWISHSTKFGFKESESVDVNVKEKPAKLELNNSFREAKACAKFWVIVFATAALMLSMRFLLGKLQKLMKNAHWDEDHILKELPSERRRKAEIGIGLLGTSAAWQLEILLEQFPTTVLPSRELQMQEILDSMQKGANLLLVFFSKYCQLQKIISPSFSA